jgi:hypothetical protein
MSAPKKRRRGDLIFLTIAALFFAVALVVYAVFSASVEVTLFNGLGAPTLIEVDGREIKVEPDAHVDVRLAGGLHSVRARTSSGRVLDETAIDAVPWNDFVAYNVLGAAGIYQQAVVYAPSNAQPSQPEVPLFFGASASSPCRRPTTCCTTRRPRSSPSTARSCAAPTSTS